MRILLCLVLLVLCRTTNSLISPLDLSALRAIRATLKSLPGGSGPNNFFSTWDFTSPDPCSTFSGITCSPDPTSSDTLRVTILTLGTGRSDSPGLTGSLSPSIAVLTELTQLILFPGRVSGTIPPQIGFLSNLRVISLTNNDLSGRIPDTFSQLENLHTLDLSHNRLSGSIQPSIITLPQLKVFVLASNGFSGDMPPIPNQQLLHIDFRNNKIEGTLRWVLPKENDGMPLSSSLRYLSLSNNVMWGPLDNGMFEEPLSELVLLDLSMNHFTGPIPPPVFKTPSLYLQRNSFSGRLPASFPVSSGEGTVVDLSHNSLYGYLPEALAGVETLFLNSNRFTGDVPEAYVESLNGRTMKTLYLQHNYISELPEGLGIGLPDSASVCVAYNCMVPPAALTVSSPASAGTQMFRPVGQCPVFSNRSTGHG